MPRSLVLALAVLGACAKGGGSTSDAQIDTPVVTDATIDSNGCSAQPCSILPQCGCTGQNTCDLDTSDNMGTACRNITVPGTETSACSSQTECDRSFTCIGGAAYASCKKFCTSNADCGSPRGQCVLGFASTAGPDVPKFCSSNCDPTDTTAAGCPSTFKCTLYTAMSGGTNYKIADCSLAGTGTQGVDCTAGSQPYEAKCAKGFQCVKLTTESTYKCRKICATPGQAGGACGGSNQCIGYTEPHTIGSTTYGVCAP